MTSVGFVTYTFTPPPVPAGIIAAFARILPPKEFRVETPGWGLPDGQSVRKARGPDGTAVTLSEYALAVSGIPQLLSERGKPRVPGASEGGPKGPLVPCPALVSTIRHGGSGKNFTAPEVLAESVP